MQKPIRKTTTRNGSAVIELAVCLPVLVLLMVGTISANSMIYFKQSLKITAYEGARVSLISGATNAQVIAQCETILKQRRVFGATVRVQPVIESVPKGTVLTVTIDAPCEENGLLANLFFSGQSYTESVSMMKEN